MQKIQLSIPEPCHQNWNHMIATERGRYCNACAKTVVDFSTMSDTELLNYFSQSQSQKVCGRAYPDQLDRIIQLPARPRKKVRVYWQYMLALFLFAGKGSVAKAQGKVRIENCAPAKEDLRSESIMVGGISAVSQENRKALYLQITDEAGKPIGFATVKLLPEGAQILADSLGRFKLKSINVIESIKVSAVGYKERVIKLNQLSGRIIKLILHAELMGDVVLIAKPAKMTMGAVSSVCSNYINDSIKNFTRRFSSQLQVFPNPATRNGVVTLAFKMSTPGIYNMQVTNNAGHVLMFKPYNTTAKKVTQQLPIPAVWDAGIYFITIMDTRGKKLGTQRLIVK